MFFPVQGDTTANAAIVERFDVHLYPTFLALSAEGEILQRWVGFAQASAWSEVVEAIKADPLTVAQREERHAAQPCFTDALALGRHAYASGSHRRAMDLYRQAQRLDPESSQSAELPIMLLRAALRGLPTEEVSIREVSSLAGEIVQAPDPKPSDALEVCYRLGSVLDQLGRERYAAILEMAHPLVANLRDEELQDYRHDFLVQYALYVEADEAKAVEMKHAGLPEGWESDPDALNGFAWWCFEQRVNLEEAERLAQQAAELARPGARQANILDTQAQIVFLLGDAEQAIALMERAAEMSPDLSYFREQLDRFRGIERAAN